MTALNYPIILEPLSKDDRGGFAAFVPDLPGCMSDGNTPEEALSHDVDAIACWIDAAYDMGRPVPEPSNHLALAE